MSNTPGDSKHGAGMSLVRRYIHEAGGRVALASLLGHETRFKVTLPAIALSDSQVAGAA
jgi:signal transduction histidine kinase